MRIGQFLKLIFCIVLFFILLPFVSTSQDSSVLNKKPFYLQAAFLYDFPQSFGFSAGINTPLSSVIKSKIYKNGRTKSKQKDYFFSANIGFYRYPYNYTGVYLFPSSGVRISKLQRHIYHEYFAGIGVLRTFYDGRVYAVDASGNIEELPLFGRYYATANLSYALGLKFENPKLQKFEVQIKPSLWIQFPFNSFIKPHISVEAGIRYHFSDVSIKTKLRTKRKYK